MQCTYQLILNAKRNQNKIFAFWVHLEERGQMYEKRDRCNAYTFDYELTQSIAMRGQCNRGGSSHSSVTAEGHPRRETIQLDHRTCTRCPT